MLGKSKSAPFDKPNSKGCASRLAPRRKMFSEASPFSARQCDPDVSGVYRRRLLYEQIAVHPFASPRDLCPLAAGFCRSALLAGHTLERNQVPPLRTSDSGGHEDSLRNRSPELRLGSRLRQG